MGLLRHEVDKLLRVLILPIVPFLRNKQLWKRKLKRRKMRKAHREAKQRSLEGKALSKPFESLTFLLLR